MITKKQNYFLLSLVFVTTICLALLLCACGESSSSKTESESPKPLDLTGTWGEVDSSSETVQEAVIEGDTITIYWVQTKDNSKMLYWAGSYVAPTSPDETYSWESKGDTEQMSKALLASQDSSKTFSYKDKQLSYEVTALGKTATAHLEKK